MALNGIVLSLVGSRISQLAVFALVSSQLLNSFPKLLVFIQLVPIECETVMEFFFLNSLMNSSHVFNR